MGLADPPDAHHPTLRVVGSRIISDKTNSVFYLVFAELPIFRGALRAPNSDLKSTHFPEIPLRFWSFQTFLFFRRKLFQFFSEKVKNFRIYFIF